MEEIHKDRESLIGSKIEKQIISLGNSINYYCEENEDISESILNEIDRSDDDYLKNLTPLQVTALHSLYLRIIGYAMLKSVTDIFLAEKLARKLGVDLVKSDISNGVDVPSEVIDSMLDEISRTLKEK